MDHKQYKEWLHLAVCDELDNEEMNQLVEHLGQCDACRTEFEELRSTISLMGDGAAEPSNEVLWEARRNLQDALRREPPPQSVLGRVASGVAVSREPRRESAPRLDVRGWLGWITGPRLALSGAATVMIGFFAGYLAFGGAAAPPQERIEPPPVPGQEVGGPQISNVRFLDVDTENGQVEIQYDLVRPVRLRASVDDDRVQRMLAYTLANEQNVGVRLEAITALDAAPLHAGDEDVKQALIKTLKWDPNPGVRKEALFVLRKMPMDNDIRDACLFVLKNDDNPGMRVASINLLAEATLGGKVEGQEVYDALKAEMSGDSYIRSRSGVFIQEVNDDDINNQEVNDAE